jgi:membrane protein DedA with SNARE-associated domain/rhodanese-related sulfurtransferase
MHQCQTIPGTKSFAPAGLPGTGTDLKATMSYLVNLIEQFGILAVFVNVLVEQLGAPVPAYPTLIIASALLSNEPMAFRDLLLTAVLAALIADLAWYAAGKRYGKRVLALLCRISLSPDSCVRQTESLFHRWGAPSLLLAKFIPGFASIARALAGALGTKAPVFLLFDCLGAAIWAGSALGLGLLFRSTVGDLLAVLESLGKWGLLLIATALALFILNRWWQRRQFIRSLRLARISVAELHDLHLLGSEPVVVDVRPAHAQSEGRIPGALAIPVSEIGRAVLDMPVDSEVIVYCACPDEASAAKVAKLLMNKGYKRVRPLTGGIDAWVAAGHGLEV